MLVQVVSGGSFEGSGGSTSGQQLPASTQLSVHEQGWQQDVKFDALCVCKTHNLYRHSLTLSHVSW